MLSSSRIDMFSLGDRGEGNTLIRLAYARSGEDDGLGCGDRQSILDAIFIQGFQGMEE